MRQFDIVRLSDLSLAILLQADLLLGTQTRVVAPLLPQSVFASKGRLHPMFRVERREYLMATEKLSAIPIADIGTVIMSAREREYDIRRALDVVFLGV
jgi:toxin CcdB